MNYRVQPSTSDAYYSDRGILRISQELESYKIYSPINPAKRFCQYIPTVCSDDENREEHTISPDQRVYEVMYADDESSNDQGFQEHESSSNDFNCAPLDLRKKRTSNAPMPSDESCDEEIKYAVRSSINNNNIIPNIISHNKPNNEEEDFDSGHSPVSDPDLAIDFEHARLQHLIQYGSEYLRGLTFRIDEIMEDDFALDDWDGKKRICRISRQKHDSIFKHHPRMGRKFNSMNESSGSHDQGRYYNLPMTTRQRSRIESAIVEIEYFVLNIMNAENLWEITKQNHYNSLLLRIIHDLDENNMRNDGNIISSVVNRIV